MRKLKASDWPSIRLVRSAPAMVRCLVLEMGDEKQGFIVIVVFSPAPLHTFRCVGCNGSNRSNDAASPSAGAECDYRLHGKLRPGQIRRRSVCHCMLRRGSVYFTGEFLRGLFM